MQISSSPLCSTKISNTIFTTGGSFSVTTCLSYLPGTAPVLCKKSHPIRYSTECRMTLFCLALSFVEPLNQEFRAASPCFSYREYVKVCNDSSNLLHKKFAERILYLAKVLVWRIFFNEHASTILAPGTFYLLSLCPLTQLTYSYEYMSPTAFRLIVTFLMVTSISLDCISCTFV